MYLSVPCLYTPQEICAYPILLVETRHALPPVPREKCTYLILLVETRHALSLHLSPDIILSNINGLLADCGYSFRPRIFSKKQPHGNRFVTTAGYGSPATPQPFLHPKTTTRQHSRNSCRTKPPTPPRDGGKQPASPHPVAPPARCPHTAFTKG